MPVTFSSRYIIIYVAELNIYLDVITFFYSALHLDVKLKLRIAIISRLSIGMRYSGGLVRVTTVQS